LEKLTEAAQHLEALRSQNPPADVLLQARAERARLALAAGQLDQALAAIAEGRTAGGQASPELDFAHLETYVALWKRAESQKNASDSAAWREKSSAMARLIEESHGPYWRRRADALLTGAASDSEAPADLEILVRTARDHYLRKRLDEAVEAYEAAAEHAHRAGDTGQAFELLYKAAAIEHQRQNRSEAARRFKELAISLPTHALAAEAHLLGCFHLAQAAREDTARIDEYGAALEEHLQYWAETAGQARIWLGKLRESQERWQDAVDAYRGVSPMHAEYEPAIAGAARSWLRRLAEMDQAKEDRAAAAKEAAEFFEAIVSAAKSDSSAGEIAASRIAALAAAKIRLEYSPEGHSRAEHVLRDALNANASAPPEWRAEATGLLVVALAGQPARVSEAQAMLRGASTTPQQRWEMIQSLAALAEESQPNIRPQLAKLVLEAIDSLGSAQAQLSPADQVTAERLRASALADAGRVEEARERFESLARQHPQDARIQEAYGELLLGSSDSAGREAALRQWRIIAQGRRPRTDRWWRAKYNIALLHFQNGDREQAAQLIRYLQEVPPGLDDSPLAQQFLDLLQRCQ
jgi:tetratricopeptide (TPR) repeat protein